MSKILAILLPILLMVLINRCTPSPISTNTAIPPTTTPVSTNTLIPPTATNIPTTTSTPIVYITLGSPFAFDCGDGIPRIWSNDSYNGPAADMPADQHHGHVDIFAPSGCDVTKYKGEVLAPISGLMVPETTSGDPNVYLLYPDPKYISGIESALEFSGIQDPQISLIDEIRLNIGHITSSLEGANTEQGVHVEKGQSIGDVVPCCNGHQKIAYQIYVTYQSVDIALSPTLFIQDIKWICVPNSPYDCIPQTHDYVP